MFSFELNFELPNFLIILVGNSFFDLIFFGNLLTKVFLFIFEFEEYSVLISVSSSIFLLVFLFKSLSEYILFLIS